MKKCYIAGKIGALPPEEVSRLFDQGKMEVDLFGLQPVSPLDLPHTHGRSWSEYMREDIAALLQCSHLYALNNWQNSRGAKIEVQLAKDLGLTIIYQDADKPVPESIQRHYGPLRNCPSCKQVTRQKRTLWKPDHPELGEVWECLDCHECVDIVGEEEMI